MHIRTRPTLEPRAEPTQRLSAQLVQTMHLLALPLTALGQEIERQMAGNPALEYAPERHCPLCGRLLFERTCPVCRPDSLNPDEPIVFVSGRELLSGFEPPDETADDLPLYDRNVTLAEFVLRQIGADLRPEDRRLAAHLLALLDDDGLIRTPLPELAFDLQTHPRDIRRVLDLIQSASPPGVGAQSAAEAMLIQVRHLAARQTPIPPFTEEILRTCLDDLTHERYGRIARRLGATAAQVRRAVAFIRHNLHPYPARTGWGDSPSAPLPTVYHQPDIILRCDAGHTQGRIIVEILLPLRAPLRVSPLYRQALHQAGPEHLDALRQQAEQAAQFVKSLQHRQHTLVRLMDFLVRYQRAFILHGDRHMRPLTRAAVARALDLHESTISRAVKDKVVQLPNGTLVGLDIFFDRSLHLRSLIRRMIREESQPLSDTQIARRLREAGFAIARRTVTKYREKEGIPPAYQRKRAARS